MKNKKNILAALICIAGFSVILSVLKIYSLASNLGKINSPQVNKIKLKNIVLGAEITATPSATPSATPTPTIAYTGYCLNIPVIFYHHVEPMAQAKQEGHGGLTVDVANFDSQMQYLVSRGYHTVTAEDVILTLRHQKSLPPKPVAVTLDDGYSDIFNYAFPITRKYGIIMNLMIPTGLMDNPGYLSWNNLGNMISSGSVFAYDHTWSHYSMPAGNDAKDQMEIMTAKQQLESHFGKTVDVFAYPYGIGNGRIQNLLVKDGFTGAYSTIGGTVQCDSFIFNLHRIRIGNASLSAYGL